jgi:hypothetical protein
MSRRLNLSGFSIGQMRRLFGSQEEAAILRIKERLSAETGLRQAGLTDQIGEIVERAVRFGVPFADLGEETDIHAIAARVLAEDGQKWLHTMASVYHDSALEASLWRLARRLASPPTRAFLRGLIEGVPLFGSQPSTDGSTYAAIGREKLLAFRPGLVDLREQIAYRIGRKTSPSDEDHAAVEFVTEFCQWIDEILEAERDLWFEFA